MPSFDRSPCSRAYANFRVAVGNERLQLRGREGFLFAAAGEWTHDGPVHWSRRDFLKGLAAATTAAIVPPMVSGENCAPRFPIRECYCPAHFGNSYEAMWPNETAAYLAEIKWWGFNRFSDWAVTTDASDPYTSDAYWSLAMEQLARKKKSFRAAQDLGLGLNLIVAPNHVYLDQLRPDLAAKRGPRIQGQLICPSVPEARELILRNLTNWFRDYAQVGIRFSALTGFAYDYGGCACEKCKPWILTFAKLFKETHEVAAHYHSGIEPWVCSWWWSPEEHRLFNDWAATYARGWLKGMTLHIEYDQAGFKAVPVPDGCSKLAFVHIGYADTNKASDIYWKWGPVVGPERIPRTLDTISQQGAVGFQAYSEGLFDDCNKALLAGLASGRCNSSDEVLAAYAKRYFGASGPASEKWAAWMAGWGDRRKVLFPGAEAVFRDLAAQAKGGWRLEHWRSKLILEKLDRGIGLPAPDAWTKEKLDLARQFWAEQEHLNRDIYRLGPLRHIFTQKARPPAWYDSWQKATKTSPAPTAVPEEA